MRCRMHGSAKPCAAIRPWVTVCSPGKRCNELLFSIVRRSTSSRIQDDKPLSLGADGVVPSLRFRDFALLARVHPVTSPLVAIIDDDDALCASLVDFVRSIGYRAEPYYSAETFLTSAKPFNSHCIVADVHMPGMSGFDLIRKLHERGIMTPVILITALSGKHLDDEAISAGAFCLLRKPFETNCLLDCIERSLPDERSMR